MLADHFSSSCLTSQHDRTSWEHPKQHSSGAWQKVFDKELQLHFAAKPLSDRVKNRACPSSPALPAPRESIIIPLLSPSLLFMSFQQIREWVQSHWNYLPNSNHQAQTPCYSNGSLQVIQSTPLLRSTVKLTQLPAFCTADALSALLSHPCATALATTEAAVTLQLIEST